MKNLSNVTLLSVCGNEKFLDGIIRAAEYSNREYRLKTKILSNVEFSHPFIECEVIRPLSYKEYSDFCVREVSDYFDTSHAIIFQEDGFILDMKFWTDEFLNYDYIGAPWPLTWNETEFPITNETNIGNSGFSLRSKAMAEKVREIVDPYMYSLPLEDVLICRKHRKELESFGFKWPETKLAAQFSVEHPIPENGFNQHDKNFVNSFGFHAIGKKSGYLELLENNT